MPIFNGSGPGDGPAGARMAPKQLDTWEPSFLCVTKAPSRSGLHHLLMVVAETNSQELATVVNPDATAAGAHKAAVHTTTKLQTATSAEQHASKGSASVPPSTTSKELSLPGRQDPAAGALLDLIEEHGGQVNLAVRHIPGVGRATFALQDFKPGDVFARIPVEMCYKLDETIDFLPVSAAYLVFEMAMPDSPWEPYFKTLPHASDVRSVANFPKSYLPLIQDRALEQSIVASQEQVQHLWERNRQQYQAVFGSDVSSANITHTLNLLMTRLFGFGQGKKMLVPLLDLANHRNGCPHTHHPGPCDPDQDQKAVEQSRSAPPALADSAGSGSFKAHSAAGADSADSKNKISGQCIVWRAGEQVAAGKEVCNNYKTLTQDRAVLQYGFLQDGPAASELSAVDRHDYKADNPWYEPPGTDGRFGPPRFSGTPQQIQAEAQRLQARLLHLDLGEEAVTALGADPDLDADGTLLAMLRLWRQQRRAAIELELARLQRQSNRLSASAATPATTTATVTTARALCTATPPHAVSAPDADGSQQVTEHVELTQWLENNGAQVSVELRQQSAAPATTSDSMTCSTVYLGKSDNCKSSSSSSSVSSSGTSVTSDKDRSSSSFEAVESGSGALSSHARAAVGVFTRKQLKKGDLLAAIPVWLAYRIQPGLGQLDSAVDLMLDLHALSTAAAAGSNNMHLSAPATQPDNSIKPGTHSATAGFFRPFLAALPRLGSIWSFFSYPEQYLPILQHPVAENHIKTLQQAMQQTWEQHRARIEAVDTSLCIAELQHALSLVTALPTIPTVISARQQLLLLPLFASAKHNSSCPHTYSIRPCSGVSTAEASSDSESKQDLCFVWTAGSDLSAVAEVCASYGHLRPDQAVWQYGLGLEPEWLQWLQSSNGISSHAQGDQSQEGMKCSAQTHQCAQQQAPLSGLDTTSSTTDAPFGPISFQPLLNNRPGTRHAAVTEAKRLHRLQEQLTATSVEDAVLQLQPAAVDAEGVILQQLRQWRNLRVITVQKELERLVQDWGIGSVELNALDLHDEAAVTHDRAQTIQHAQPKGRSTSSSSSSNNEGDQWANLITWLRQYGAVVNVDVADAGPGRGRVVVANETMRRGDLLAAIPVDICYQIEGLDVNTTWGMASANLLAHILDARSPWRPYLDALPSPDEVVSPLVSMPQEYVHLLQSNDVESYVQEYQGTVTSFWRKHAANFARDLPGVSYQDFVYARSLLITRLFSLDSGQVALVPLLDLANHAHNCPNIHTEGPCPSDSSRLCVLWQSGEYIAPGAEVCNSYKFMTNERSMLQYGFLQDGPIATQLHLLDYPDFGEKLWSPYERLWMGPQEFNGTQTEMQAEAARLRAVLDKLAATDAVAATTMPALSDRGGQLLGLILQWRQQRKAALRSEIARLEGQLSAGTEEGPSPDDALINWIKDNGGMVVGIGVQGAQELAAAEDQAPHQHVEHLVATQHMRKGSVLAAVPLNLCLGIYKRDLLLDAPTIWSDIRHTRGPHRPYWLSLPSAHDVLSVYNMPLKYAPVIQHEPTERFMKMLRTAVRDVFQKHPKSYEDSNMTRKDVPYVLSLVATRGMDFEQGTFFVPLIDKASHDNQCTNTVNITACDQLLQATRKDNGGRKTAAPNMPSSSSKRAVNNTQWCVALTAGADLAPGDSVCIKREHLLPDKAMLQYGVLLAQKPVAAAAVAASDGGADGTAVSMRVPLFGMDRHDFVTHAVDQLPWQMHSQTQPALFTGTSAEVAAEVIRLQDLVAALQSDDTAAAAVVPVASDPRGHVLQALRQWRELRKAAIAQEIERLGQS